MPEVTIHVSAGHIARGCPSDSWDCPVWHAIRAAFPATRPGETLAVGPDTFVFVIGDPASDAMAAEVPLPAAARRFIAIFDGGTAPGPFSFTVDVPDWLHALYRPAVAGA